MDRLTVASHARTDFAERKRRIRLPAHSGDANSSGSERAYSRCCVTDHPSSDSRPQNRPRSVSRLPFQSSVRRSTRPTERRVVRSIDTCSGRSSQISVSAASGTMVPSLRW